MEMFQKSSMPTKTREAKNNQIKRPTTKEEATATHNSETITRENWGSSMMILMITPTTDTKLVEEGNSEVTIATTLVPMTSEGTFPQEIAHRAENLHTKGKRLK